MLFSFPLSPTPYKNNKFPPHKKEKGYLKLKKVGSLLVLGQRNARDSRAHTRQAGGINLVHLDELNIDDERCVIVRITAKVVLLVLPEVVRVQECRRHNTIQQTRRYVLLLAPRKVVRVGGIPEDHHRRRVGILCIRMASAVPFPSGPWVHTVIEGWLHLSQGVVHIRCVFERAIEPPAVRHDVVDLHNAQRAEDKDLLPGPAQLGV